MAVMVCDYSDRSVSSIQHCCQGGGTLEFIVWAVVAVWVLFIQSYVLTGTLDRPSHACETRLSYLTGYTTLLRRWINVNDVDSTSQQRRVPSRTPPQAIRRTHEEGIKHLLDLVDQTHSTIFCLPPPPDHYWPPFKSPVDPELGLRVYNIILEK